MREKIYPAALILILLTSSCATLNRTEITSLNRVEFEPLRLKPDFESNDLRIDLIRQSIDNHINDSTVESQDTDYHPLGFDLGNGMFYDLNDNLCFRLDKLLGVSDTDCWSMERISRRKQKWADCIYTFCNDSLTVRYPPRHREHYLLHRLPADEGSVSVMWRNRLLYTVDLDDESAVYRYKRRKVDIILRSGENHYTIRKGWWKENYQLQGNRLLLKRNYIIELTGDRKKIKVIRPGWLGSRVLLTIEKGSDRLYIYDRNYRGRKIEFTDTGLSVYHNRAFIEGWKLK